MYEQGSLVKKCHGLYGRSQYDNFLGKWWENWPEPWGLTSTTNGTLFIYNFEESPGTNIELVSVKWSGSNTGNGIKTRLLKRDETAATYDMSVVQDFQVFIRAAMDPEIQVSSIPIDPFTIDQQYSWYLEITSIVSAGYSMLMSLNISTRLRNL
ncbi:MAG TPA: hypothetical protein VMW91_05540 [Desulfosporosinus sp.]|nr:hypothetical protein [Desulfosporosinus sp.]